VCCTSRRPTVPKSWPRASGRSRRRRWSGRRHSVVDPSPRHLAHSPGELPKDLETSSGHVLRFLFSFDPTLSLDVAMLAYATRVLVISWVSLGARTHPTNLKQGQEGLGDHRRRCGVRGRGGSARRQRFHRRGPGDPGDHHGFPTAVLLASVFVSLPHDTRFCGPMAFRSRALEPLFLSLSLSLQVTRRVVRPAASPPAAASFGQFTSAPLFRQVRPSAQKKERGKATGRFVHGAATKGGPVGVYRRHASLPASKSLPAAPRL